MRINTIQYSTVQYSQYNTLQYNRKYSSAMTERPRELGDFKGWANLRPNFRLKGYVVIVGVIRRKPVLTHATIVCGMLASVNSVKSVSRQYLWTVMDTGS